MRLQLALLVSFLSCSIGLADNWRSLTPPPEFETLRGACWNPEGFSLVGDNGAILWSANGNAWLVASSGLIRDLNSVASDGSIRVAVGDRGSWTKSLHGISWEAGSPITTRELNGVTHGESGFVAVGTKNTIFRSQDASMWTDHSTALGTFRHYLDVESGGGLYVAVGTDGAISVSSNGEDWQPHDVSASDLCSVSFSGSMWVAITRRGEIWRSSDGSTWSEVADLSWPYGDHDLIWNDLDSFIAVGKSGMVGLSGDGVSWAISSSPVKTPLYCVAASPERSVAGGADGAILVQDPSGVWTDRSLGVGANLRGVASSESIGVAVGEDGTILCREGGSWTRIPSLTEATLNSVNWDDGLFIAVGNEGEILVSGDGVSWLPESSGVSEHLHAVTQDGPATVAVGADDSILIKNGASWELKYSDFFGGVLKGIAWTGSQYVAVGTEAILFSPDGNIWNPVSGSHPRLGGVTWTGSELVAVVGDPSYDGVYASVDGNTWTHRESGFNEDFAAISKAGDALLAVGEQGGIFISSDGLFWSKVRPSGSSGQRGVTFSSGVATVVGDKGAIISSSDLVNWTGRVLPDVNLNGAFWSGEFLGVIGNAGLLATSPDGIEWTTHFVGVDTPLRAGVQGSLGTVVVGDQGAAFHAVERSTWSPLSTGFSGSLSDVAWNGSTYIAVGTDQTILSSGNVVDWTQRYSGFPCRVQSVVWEGNQWIACGDGGFVFSSPDGISWTRERLATNYNLTDLDVLNGITVAVATNGIWESIDGGPWGFTSLGQATPYTAVASNSSETVLTSGFGQVAIRPYGQNWQTSSVSLSQELADLEPVNSKLVGVSLSGRVLLMDRAESPILEPWLAAAGVGLGEREHHQRGANPFLPNLLAYTLGNVGLKDSDALLKMVVSSDASRPVLVFSRGARMPGVSLTLQKLETDPVFAWTDVAVETANGWAGLVHVDEQEELTGEVTVTAYVAADEEVSGIFRLQSNIDQ